MCSILSYEDMIVDILTILILHTIGYNCNKMSEDLQEIHFKEKTTNFI